MVAFYKVSNGEQTKIVTVKNVDDLAHAQIIRRDLLRLEMGCVTATLISLEDYAVVWTSSEIKAEIRVTQQIAKKIKKGAK